MRSKAKKSAFVVSLVLVGILSFNFLSSRLFRTKTSSEHDPDVREVGKGSFFYGKGVIQAANHARILLRVNEADIKIIDVSDDARLEELKSFLITETAKQMNLVPYRPSYLSIEFDLTITLYAFNRGRKFNPERLQENADSFLVEIPITKFTTGKDLARTDKLVEEVRTRIASWGNGVR